MHTSTQKVLVAGASGYLGGALVRVLKDHGYWVRVLVRTQKQADRLSQFSDEQFIGEITHPATLAGVCKDIDWVFSSVGITRQKDGLTYMDVDYQGNMNLLEQAIAAKVQQFLYVSVLHGDRLLHLDLVAAKERFVEALHASSIQSCITRPTGFFSDMDEFLEMAFKGKVWLMGKGQFRSNPIHGDDLAEACIRQMEQQTPEMEIGGPEILTHEEIALTAFDALDQSPKLGFVPLWLVGPLRWLLRLFTAKPYYGPIEFFMTVLSMDMIAPTHGERTLAQHFRK